MVEKTVPIFNTLDYGTARLNDARLSDIRFIIVLASIFIYAVFASPTPDRLGIAEAIIATGLIIGTGWRGIGYLVNRRGLGDAPLWYHCGRFVFLSLVFTGALPFLLYGHEAGDAARDVVALCFLFLPVLLYPLLKEDEGRYHLLFMTLIFAGGIFALRSLSLFLHAPIFNFLNSDALSYLANAPTVLFAGMISALYLARVITGQTQMQWALLIVAIILAFIVLAAITLTLQRASVIVFLLSVIFILGRGFKFNPSRTIVCVCVCLLLAAMIWPMIADIARAFSYKTRTAGVNMRVEDLKAIWAAISDNPLSLMFGLGFGGNFQSPAVGHYTVNFAHGLIPAALLKHGVAGCVLITGYIAALGWELMRLRDNRADIFCALFAPLMICVFLYASYKSLDFGLILCLIAFSSVAHSPCSRNLR